MKVEFIQTTNSLHETQNTIGWIPSILFLLEKCWLELIAFPHRSLQLYNDFLKIWAIKPVTPEMNIALQSLLCERLQLLSVTVMLPETFFFSAVDTLGSIG